jgi:hypothetical protein
VYSSQTHVRITIAAVAGYSKKATVTCAHVGRWVKTRRGEGCQLVHICWSSMWCRVSWLGLGEGWYIAAREDRRSIDVNVILPRVALQSLRLRGQVV